jgi:hypothetical protein
MCGLHKNCSKPYHYVSSCDIVEIMFKTPQISFDHCLVYLLIWFFDGLISIQSLKVHSIIYFLMGFRIICQYWYSWFVILNDFIIKPITKLQMIFFKDFVLWTQQFTFYVSMFSLNQKMCDTHET